MRTRALFALATYYLTATISFAQTTTMGEIAEAASREGDKSRQALVSIYGNVVNNPLAASGGEDSILSAIFQITNGALLVIGAFYAAYIMFRKLTQTAHDGSVYDRDKNTLWGPIRLVWGVSLLVPTANGWALSQLLMLWAASLMGVGVANLGVDASVEALRNGQSMVVQPVMPSTVSLARSVFEANLCMHSINSGLAQAQAAGALVSSDDFVQLSKTSSGFILRNQSFICGGADINTELEPRVRSVGRIAIDIDVSDIRRAHLKALADMEQSLMRSANEYVNSVVRMQSGEGALNDAGIAVQSAAQVYENAINATVATKQGNIAELGDKVSDSIKDAGWWALGAWYQTFAQSNTKLSDAVAARAAVFGMSPEGDPGMLAVYETVMMAYRSQQITSRLTPALGSTSASDSSKIIGSIFRAPGQRLVDQLVNADFGAEGTGQVNPLIKMKNLGDYTMSAAEIGLGAYVVGKAAMDIKNGWSVAGIAAKTVNTFTAIGDAAQGVFESMSPFVIMAIAGLFLLGGTLSTYIPMVPFIIWFAACINWLVVVGEAVVAAPLWALTHLGGEGDGFGQKTAHGTTFALNLMIRPILMVIGFFLGGAGIVAGGTLLNQLFGIALANAQFDSVTGLFSVIFYLVIYASMALNLVHSCFNLIFIVPDQVISWVGGHAGGTPGREDADKLRSDVGTFTGKLEGGLRPGGAKTGARTRSGNGIRS